MGNSITENTATHVTGYRSYIGGKGGAIVNCGAVIMENEITNNVLAGSGADIAECDGLITANLISNNTVTLDHQDSGGTVSSGGAFRHAEAPLLGTSYNRIRLRMAAVCPNATVILTKTKYEET